MSDKSAYTINPGKRFVPAIDVDCSECGKFLEIALPVSDKVSAEEQANQIGILVDAIDKLDAARGGSKFRLIGQKAVNGNVVLTLAPIELDNAKERMDHIINTLNRIVEKQVRIAYARVA